MKILGLLLGLLCLGALVTLLYPKRAQAGNSITAPLNNAHQFTFVGIDNTSMLLEDFKGKPSWS